jgi:hypothetical protein
MDTKKDKGWKDEGYYVFSSTLATDGLASGPRRSVRMYVYSPRLQDLIKNSGPIFLLRSSV